MNKDRSSVQPEGATIIDGYSALPGIRRRYELLNPILDERLRRLWAAAEALVLGTGGVSILSGATGLSRTTIRAGIEELRNPGGELAQLAKAGRVRRPGAGRKAVVERDTTLEADLEALMESSREAGAHLIDWTCKSIRGLADELAAMGHQVSYRTVGNLLHRQGFRFSRAEIYKKSSLASRCEQYHLLSHRAALFLERSEPVVSLTLADEPTHQPIHVEPGAAGWAASVLRYWWQETGVDRFPRSRNLLLLIDSARPPGAAADWTAGLQALAEGAGLEIVAIHFPPGAWRWRRSVRELTCSSTEPGTKRSLTVGLDLVLPPDAELSPSSLSG